MGFQDIANKELYWLEGTGPHANIVISSRVRLARNLQGRRFTHHASVAELQAIRREITQRVMDRPSFTEGWLLEMEDCTPIQRKCLLEKHLASQELLRNHHQSALLVSDNLSRVVMVNEEDHLRIQAFQSGYNPVTACHAALALDSELEESLDFAFNDDLGYLTSCPTNVGTGFRLSVLIHLPGLFLSNEIEKILNSLRQLQFTVRGLFGEGSAVRGALFQISNLGTLGRSEENLTTDFSRHVSKVIHYETLAREKLLEKDPVGVRDMVHRSLGILHSAHLMTTQEAFDRLSHVRLGVSLGILPAVPTILMNNALVRMQSAHIQVEAGRPVKGRERSAARATYLRELLT